MTRGNPALFCKSFGWKRTIKWFDRTGYATLTGNRRAKVELDNQNYADHYSAFRVTIINTHEGTVDTKLFRFADYIPYQRVDNRQTDLLTQPFEVISHCGWEWYIAVPKDVKPLVRAIEEYIEIFE
jgi:hypothetical protein